MKSEDLATLNHLVIDGNAWDARQRAHFIKKHGHEEGTKIADANLAAKVKRIREKTDYLRVKNAPDYQNRSQRDAVEKAAQDKEIAERAAEAQAAQAAKEKELEDRILARIQAAQQAGR